MSLTTGPLPGRLMRYPDVSNTDIVFVYAGDLWIVGKKGGEARRLSSGIGEESFPRFSPDGQRVAFSANYDGTSESVFGGGDLYMLPVEGGVLQRLTSHPASDRMLDWYRAPKGEDELRILFASSRQSNGFYHNRLFTMSAEGGHATPLPLPQGEFGSVSQDGRFLALQLYSQDFQPWRSYRGGQLNRIYLFDLETREVTALSEENENAAHPMWLLKDNYLLYISDRLQKDNSYTYNLWAREIDAGCPGKRFPLTCFSEDIRFPAIGPSDVVFQLGDRLLCVDLKRLFPNEHPLRRPLVDSHSDKYELEITVAHDQSEQRPVVRNVAETARSATLSPDGTQVALEARGDIWVVPTAPPGVSRNLTPGTGEAARYPSFCPRSPHIAYFSDAETETPLSCNPASRKHEQSTPGINADTPEYQLMIRATAGGGAIGIATDLRTGFRYRPFWSPDGSKLAYLDSERLTLRIAVLTPDWEKCLLENRGFIRIDQQSIEVAKLSRLSHDECLDFLIQWSNCSQWITYADVGTNLQRMIYVYDVGQRTEPVPITSGAYDDSQPLFAMDIEGCESIYFLTFRRPTAISDFRTDSLTLVDGTQLARIRFTPDAIRDSLKKRESLSALERYVELLSVPAATYRRLMGVGTKLYLEQRPPAGLSAPNQILEYDIDDRKWKILHASAAQRTALIDVSPNLLLQGPDGKYSLLKPSKESKPVPLRLNALVIQREPREEWKQILRDAWRFCRDFFHDSTLAEVSWPAVLQKAQRSLMHASTRRDLTYLIDSMLSELRSSHASTSDGDVQEAETQSLGTLGLDLKIERSGNKTVYAIDQILQGATWDLDARSPFFPDLLEPGEQLLAINGNDLDPSQVSPWSSLQGLAGEFIELKVAGASTPHEPRTFTIKALRWSEERSLRYCAWAEGNRRAIEEEFAEKVGYIHIAHTYHSPLPGSQSYTLQQFQAQFNRPILIIDLRFNGGGDEPYSIFQLMTRSPLYHLRLRPNPALRLPRPPQAGTTRRIVMINGYTSSSGEILAWLFKNRDSAAKLLGRRTAGRALSRVGGFPLVDGGSLKVPTLAFYDELGRLISEGHGVEPDFPVKEEAVLRSISSPSACDPDLRAATEIIRGRYLNGHSPSREAGG